MKTRCSRLIATWMVILCSALGVGSAHALSDMGSIDTNGVPIRVTIGTGFIDHLNFNVAISLERLYDLQTIPSLRLIDQVNMEVAQDIVEDGGYTVSMDWTWVSSPFNPLGPPRVYKRPTGEALEIKPFLSNYQHNVVRDGNGNIIGETFNQGKVSLSLADGVHDLEWEYCPTAGYSGCMKRPFTAVFGDGLLAWIVKKAHAPIAGNCFARMTLEKGGSKVCLDVDPYDPRTPPFNDADWFIIGGSKSSIPGQFFGAEIFDDMYRKTMDSAPTTWKNLCNTDFPECKEMWNFAAIAKVIGTNCRSYYGAGSPQDEGNALQHAAWNALMAKRLGSVQAAHDWSNAMEGNQCVLNGPEPSSVPANSRMDCANNQAGLDIYAANPNATDTQLVAAVEQAVKNSTNGTVVTTPSGANGTRTCAPLILPGPLY